MDNVFTDDSQLSVIATDAIGPALACELGLLERYTQPETGRVSLCYRATYAPRAGADVAFSERDAALANARVKAALEAQLGVEMRDSAWRALLA